MHNLKEITDDIGSVSDEVSSLILCSLTRNGTDASDTYANDIYLIALDFHIEVNNIGSESGTSY